MNKIKVYLTLIGEDFDPEAVSRQIGMPPDEIRLPGEILGNGRRFGHTEWSLETEREDRDDLEPLLRRLLNRLPCSPRRLKEIAEEHSAEWDILIWLTASGSESPLLIFPRDVIQFIGEMGAAVGFDNYIC